MSTLTYYCDKGRHLICTPYTIANLHFMAADLNIHKCWFHNKRGRWHYDIPKGRIQEIESKCKVVSSQEIIDIIENGIGNIESSRNRIIKKMFSNPLNIKPNEKI